MVGGAWVIKVHLLAIAHATGAGADHQPHFAAMVWRHRAQGLFPGPECKGRVCVKFIGDDGIDDTKRHRGTEWQLGLAYLLQTGLAAQQCPVLLPNA